MTDWAAVRDGMEAARSNGAPGEHATSEEARLAGGPDFLAEVTSKREADWHAGYDHAILLARAIEHRKV